MITSTITLGSLTFGDVEYQGWSFRELIDWWGQTEDKLDVVERPQAHGAFDVERSLRTSRAISFTGTFIGVDQASVENAYDDLSAVGAEGPVQMVVTTPAGATSRTVTVERVSPVDHRGRKYGRFAVDLIARDPRRYAFDVQSVVTGPVTAGQGRTWPAVWPLVWPSGGVSGRITLTNTGKAPTAPTFVLTGGFDTALITCLETGARIGFNRQVPVGSSVVIDTAERRAMIDGQSDVSRWLRYREWELVPPGASRTYQFDATGVVTSPAGPAVEVDRNRFVDPIPASMSIFAPSGGTAALTGGGITLTATAASAASNTTRLNVQTGAGRALVSPGETVEFSADAASAQSVSGSISILFYNSVGTYITGSIVQIAPFANTPAFQRRTLSTVAPAGTASAAFYLGNGGTIAVGDTITFARMRFGAPGDYFDGSMAPSGSNFYSWAGPVNASESIKWFQPPAAATASLEGQVRSAWW